MSGDGTVTLDVEVDGADQARSALDSVGRSSAQALHEVSEANRAAREASRGAEAAARAQAAQQRSVAEAARAEAAQHRAAAEANRTHTEAAKTAAAAAQAQAAAQRAAGEAARTEAAQHRAAAEAIRTHTEAARAQAATANAQAAAARAATAELARQAAEMRRATQEQRAATQAMAGHRQQTQALIRDLGMLAGSLLSVATALATIKAGFESHSEVEDLQAGIAAVVASQQTITDAATGRQIEGLEKLRVAQDQVAEIWQQMKQDAINTTATLPQLADAFSTAVGPAMQLGISLADTEKLTVHMVQAMGALKIPLDEARQEMQSLLTGNITNDSKLADRLGVTPELARQWKQRGTTLKELEKRLADFAAAGELAGARWSGLTSTLADNLQELNRTFTGGAFEELKKGITSAIDSLKSDEMVDMAIKFGTILQDGVAGAIEGARTLGSVLLTAGQGLFDILRQVQILGARLGGTAFTSRMRRERMQRDLFPGMTADQRKETESILFALQGGGSKYLPHRLGAGFTDLERIEAFKKLRKEQKMSPALDERFESLVFDTRFQGVQGAESQVDDIRNRVSDRLTQMTFTPRDLSKYKTTTKTPPPSQDQRDAAAKSRDFTADLLADARMRAQDDPRQRAIIELDEWRRGKIEEARKLKTGVDAALQAVETAYKARKDEMKRKWEREDAQVLRDAAAKMRDNGADEARDFLRGLEGLTPDAALERIRTARAAILNRPGAELHAAQVRVRNALQSRIGPSQHPGGVAGEIDQAFASLKQRSLSQQELGQLQALNKAEDDLVAERKKKRADLAKELQRDLATIDKESADQRRAQAKQELDEALALAEKGSKLEADARTRYQKRLTDIDREEAEERIKIALSAQQQIAKILGGGTGGAIRGVAGAAGDILGMFGAPGMVVGGAISGLGDIFGGLADAIEQPREGERERKAAKEKTQSDLRATIYAEKEERRLANMAPFDRRLAEEEKRYREERDTAKDGPAYLLKEVTEAHFARVKQIEEEKAELARKTAEEQCAAARAQKEAADQQMWANGRALQRSKGDLEDTLAGLKDKDAFLAGTLSEREFKDRESKRQIARDREAAFKDLEGMFPDLAKKLRDSLKDGWDLSSEQIVGTIAHQLGWVGEGKNARWVAPNPDDANYKIIRDMFPELRTRDELNERIKLILDTIQTKISIQVKEDKRLTPGATPQNPLYTHMVNAKDVWGFAAESFYYRTVSDPSVRADRGIQVSGHRSGAGAA